MQIKNSCPSGNARRRLACRLAERLEKMLDRWFAAEEENYYYDERLYFERQYVRNEHIHLIQKTK